MNLYAMMAIIFVVVVPALAACGRESSAIPVPTATAIPVPTQGPAPSPTPLPSPTADVWDFYRATLDHFEVPAPTDQQLADACMGHEYMGWPEDVDALVAWGETATFADKAALGHILSDTSPRYAMDNGYIKGALAGVPVPERRKFCAKYR